MVLGIGMNNLAGLAALAATGNAPLATALANANQASNLAARLLAEIAPKDEAPPPDHLKDMRETDKTTTREEKARPERAAERIADALTSGQTLEEVAERRGMTRNQVLQALRNGGMTVSETQPGDVRNTTITDRDDDLSITESTDYQSGHTYIRAQEGDVYKYHADDGDGGSIDSTANGHTGETRVIEIDPDGGRTVDRRTDTEGVTTVRITETDGTIRSFEVQPGDTAHLELRLREEGLLEGEIPSSYQTWLDNAARNGVNADTLVEIARNHDISANSFDALNSLEAVTDRDGKTFYLLPTDISGDDARTAVVLTYIQNAGTGYDTAFGSENNDFAPTPYGAAEVQRIIDRQAANDWTYNDDVDFVHDNGGRLATTPNGMLMGLGGNWLQDRFSTNGGTAWGDTFMLNIDGPKGDEAAQVLREAIQSGEATYANDEGELYQSNLDLDRLLHHEERHSQQWAEHGHKGFLAAYGWEAIKAFGDGEKISFEQDAGLSDGGYITGQTRVSDSGASGATDHRS